MSDDPIVIIGGSSGIGLAVARRCLAEGHRVVIAGRSEKRLEAARAELGGPAGRLTATRADLADLAARLPGKRNGRPEDVANAIMFLMNDDFVTGTVLHAEGGQLLV